MSIITENNRPKERLLEENLRSLDRQKFADWTDPELLSGLITYQGLHVESRVSRPDLGLHTVTATFGDTFTGAGELQSAIDHHLREMKSLYGLDPVGESLADKSGFSVSHWGREVPYELTLPQQVALGSTVALDTISQAGLDVSDIDSLAVASSFPLSHMLAKYIGEAIGLRPDAKTKLFAAACYSQAMAFNEAVDHPQGDHTLILGVETFMGMRKPTDQTPGITDRAALSMFTDKLTGLIVDPHHFRTVISADHEARDKDGALTGTMIIPLLGNTNPSDSLVHQTHLSDMIEYPQPTLYQLVYMRAMATTRFFLTFIRDMVDKKFIKQGGKEFLDSVNYAICHHPSILIHQKIKSIYEKAGLAKDIMPWSSDYGNAPVCIFAEEMARIMRDLKPGDRILSTFFGAGAKGSARILEVV